MRWGGGGRGHRLLALLRAATCLVQIFLGGDRSQNLQRVSQGVKAGVGQAAVRVHISQCGVHLAPVDAWSCGDIAMAPLELQPAARGALHGGVRSVIRAGGEFGGDGRHE